MALITGYLRQKCRWTMRTTESGWDAYGQTVAPQSVEIKCRWEIKAGFVRGLMGDGSGQSSAMAVQHKVMVESPVCEGDTLTYTDAAGGKEIGGTVRSIESIVDMAGKEQGRICYV